MLTGSSGRNRNGHRYYEEADLLRLQQILLMRELDLGLREIQAVLDSQLDQVAVPGGTTNGCSRNGTGWRRWPVRSAAPSPNWKKVRPRALWRRSTSRRTCSRGSSPLPRPRPRYGSGRRRRGSSSGRPSRR
ncbi:MerR family transcriptional regulator [Streptomyces sp. NPDC056910]|uniref:MerR family transcriptional regulator n=1 Tax=Streptomyces sp. NPDC056910 TaxID=3345964 RepID=UPI00368DC5D1